MQAWAERLLYGQLLAVVTGWNRPIAAHQLKALLPEIHHSKISVARRAGTDFKDDVALSHPASTWFVRTES
jgi:hypothetical protein